MWVIKRLNREHPDEGPLWEDTIWHLCAGHPQSAYPGHYDPESIESATEFVDEHLAALYPTENYMVAWKEDDGSHSEG